MRFRNPSSLINKIRRSHSKKSCDRENLLVHDPDQVESIFDKKYWKKKRGSTPEHCWEFVVGQELKEYLVPSKYFWVSELQELIKTHERYVDRRTGEPIVLHESCSTETFEKLLHQIVKNRKWRSNN